MSDLAHYQFTRGDVDYYVAWSAAGTRVIASIVANGIVQHSIKRTYPGLLFRHEAVEMVADAIATVRKPPIGPKEDEP